VYCFDDWLFRAQDAISDYFCDPTSTTSITALLAFFELCPLDAVPIETTARKFALVHSESSGWLRPEELFYLDYCGRVLLYEKNDGFDIMWCDMDCNNADEYIHSAAIVKIISSLSTKKLLLIFRHGDRIAFGSQRSFHSPTANNFCVSDYLDAQQWSVIADILCFHNPSIADIADAIMLHSTAESHNPDYDRKVYSQAYLDMLWDVDVYAGIDTSNERRSYWNQFLPTDPVYRCSYHDACRELRGIAALAGMDEDVWELEVYESETVFDSDEAMLDDFIGEAENYSDEDEEDSEDTDWLSEFSDKAFANAEQMLKELLKRPQLD